MSVFDYKMFDNIDLSKQDITIQKQDNIVIMAEKLCKKFIDKVESGRARSKETYADCKELYKLIQEHKKYI